MNPLEQLKEKVGMLIKKAAALEKENAQLKVAMAKQQRELEQARRNAGGADAVGAFLSSDAVGEAERHAMLENLDVVIGEIDKILATLND